MFLGLRLISLDSVFQSPQIPFPASLCFRLSIAVDSSPPPLTSIESAIGSSSEVGEVDFSRGRCATVLYLNECEGQIVSQMEDSWSRASLVKRIVDVLFQVDYEQLLTMGYRQAGG